jgi:selenium-binding protein 1
MRAPREEVVYVAALHTGTYGWQTCSSAFDCCELERRYLVVPGFRSSRVHIVDVATDPRSPRLHKVIEPEELKAKTGRGPQMLQLSMDGRRLYVTTSLYSTWDNQFYPDLRGWMLKLDAGDGGLRVDPDFFVDFHPARAHEIHLPGGDPTTEIFS